MRLTRWMAFVAVMALVVSSISAPAVAQTAPADKLHSALEPVSRGTGRGWMARHEKMNARVKQGNVDLLMIGDSITHGWEGSGKEIWAKYYTARNAVNLGIGGDRTQHVIWRLQNGNIEGLSPKAAVLMIGTNNSKDNTPQEIADGIEAIVKIIRTDLPETKILILAIFSRGENNDDPRRQVNEQTNQIVCKLADGKMIHYLDINEKFLEADGTLTREIMPDLLHPREKGYTIWAEAIEPTVAKLMGEK
jgi:lysophospholipase L1-like esterase